MPSLEEILEIISTAEENQRSLSWEEMAKVTNELYKDGKYPEPKIISSAEDQDRDALLLALRIAGTGEDLYAKRLMKLIPSPNGHIPSVMTEIYFG
jgi:hypothetical protein